MANRTDPLAHSIHGTNPQNLVEKILRTKIWQSMYWKEHCFGLTAETLVDKAVELKHCGGTYGGQRKPTNFMCLLLKLLQLQPEKEIVVEFIKNEDYKYVRLLGAFYLRLVGKPLEVYQYLEPLYNDYRRIRLQTEDGHFALTHVDELVDEMLRNEYLFDIALPRVPNRWTMEQVHNLETRISVLEDEYDEEADETAAEAAKKAAEDLEREIEEEREAAERKRPRERSRERDRERSRERDRERSRERERGSEWNRDKIRDSKRPRDREYERDRERDRRDRDKERDRDRDRGRDRRDRDEPKERRRGKDDGLSIEETNAMRAKLGLKPLK